MLSMPVNVRESQRKSGKARKTPVNRLPTIPTEADWEALIKEAEIEKTKRVVIEQSSRLTKHEWTQGLGSLMWTAADWRLLPNLRKHAHAQGYGGPLQKITLPRCQHGVYLTNHPMPELDYEDKVLEWKSSYCDCCFPKWLPLKKKGNPLYIDVLLRRLKEENEVRFLCIRRRPLEQGEYVRLKEKLFDGMPVYPEVFTKAIRLRGRTLATDLRLQEDPETGKPRLETMAGYVGKAFGYGRAGKGHGPDSDADDLRMAWFGASEDSPFGHDDGEEFSSHEGWNATLPSVYPPCLNNQKTKLGPGAFLPHHPDWYSFWGWRGITEENWQPYSFSILQGEVRTNTIGGFGLKESEFFEDGRSNNMDPGTMRNLISWSQTRRHQQLRIQTPDGRGGASSFLEERIPNSKYLLDDRRKPDSCRAVSFIAFYVPLGEKKSEREPVQYRSLRWLDDRSLVHSIEPALRPEFPDLDKWVSPIEWVTRNGVMQARFTTAAILHSGMPTARHFAQWTRKAEYQRGGGVHRIPRRRTPRWSDIWRTERPMRDLAADIKMYRWGVVNQDPERLPDIPAKVAHRADDGTTRELQVETMCATAYENYRLARLALATKHGKAGFWRAERLEGSER